MSKIIIEKKDILDFNADCVVNAANEYLSYGGGVCGAIFRAAGIDELEEACNKIGHCETGNAVITPSFNLIKYKYIIHAVGPIYSTHNIQYCRDALYDAYMNSLNVMLNNGCNSIVFPLISSGIYGYPIEEAWRVAIKACRTFNRTHKEDISIFFAVISQDVYEIGNKILAKVLWEDYK